MKIVKLIFLLLFLDSCKTSQENKTSKKEKPIIEDTSSGSSSFTNNKQIKKIFINSQNLIPYGYVVLIDLELSNIKFEIPDTRNIPANCEKEPFRSNKKKCLLEKKTCGNSNLEGREVIYPDNSKKKRKLQFPLHNLNKWADLYSYNFFVNANFIDIRGRENYSNYRSCTAIVGSLVGNIGEIVPKNEVAMYKNKSSGIDFPLYPDSLILEKKDIGYNAKMYSFEDMQKNTEIIKQGDIVLSGYLVLRNSIIPNYIPGSVQKDEKIGRTIIGISGSKLIIAVVQPGISSNKSKNNAGVDLKNIISKLQDRFNISEAISLDGSGASQLLYRGVEKDEIFITRPSEVDPYTMELKSRPLASFLGFYGIPLLFEIQNYADANEIEISKFNF